MTDEKHNDRSLLHSCKLCGAPVGMACLEWLQIKQLNVAFDGIERAFATPEAVAS
jgi:hypothetical protein